MNSNKCVSGWFLGECISGVKDFTTMQNIGSELNKPGEYV